MRSATQRAETKRRFFGLFCYILLKMLTCSTKKKVYATREQAIQALLDSRVKFDFSPGPVAVYQCDDCGYFHLTSKGPIDETLRKQLSEGKIALQKEADRWLNKLKKR